MIFWRMFNKNLLHSFKVEFVMTILRIIPYVDKNDKITLDWRMFNESLIPYVDNKKDLRIK